MVVEFKNRLVMDFTHHQVTDSRSASHCCGTQEPPGHEVGGCGIQEQMSREVLWNSRTDESRSVVEFTNHGVVKLLWDL